MAPVAETLLASPISVSAMFQARLGLLFVESGYE